MDDETSEHWSWRTSTPRWCSTDGPASCLGARARRHGAPAGGGAEPPVAARGRTPRHRPRHVRHRYGPSATSPSERSPHGCCSAWVRCCATRSTPTPRSGPSSIAGCGATSATSCWLPRGGQQALACPPTPSRRCANAPAARSRRSASPGYDVVGDLDELYGDPPAADSRNPEEVTSDQMLDVAIPLVADLLRRVRDETVRAEQAEQRAKRAEKRARLAEGGQGGRTGAGGCTARPQPEPWCIVGPALGPAPSFDRSAALRPPLAVSIPIGRARRYGHSTAPRATGQATRCAS